MSKSLINKVSQAYQEVFNNTPEHVIYAPGRINLIGEHTDYSDGFVMPVAINLGIVLAISSRPDKLMKIHSLDFDALGEFDLTEFQKGKSGWLEYVKGVAWVLQESGYDLKGLQGVFSGNIPIGAGLSSSAAVEIATVKAFSLTTELSLTAAEMAKIGRKAESDWVGVNVGIMDQLISAGGKANHAVLLDCKTMAYEYVSIPNKVSMVVMDTMTRRELTSSQYNTRYTEVKTASELLRVPTLRDATLTMLNENKSLLSPIVYRRARHVVTENMRVHEFSKSMRNSDIKEMGRIINASHASLRDDYEVSSRELNTIVDIAQGHPACYGARMTGAGFGGCALALVETQSLSSFLDHVDQVYLADTKIKPNIFNVESSDGVQSL